MALPASHPVTSIELAVPVSHLAPQSQTRSCAHASPKSLYCHLIELPGDQPLAPGDDWHIKSQNEHSDAWLVREGQDGQGSTFRLKKVLATNRLLLFSGTDMARALDCYYEATPAYLDESTGSPLSFLLSYLATDALYPSGLSSLSLMSLDELRQIVPISGMELQAVLDAHDAFSLEGKIRRLAPGYADRVHQYIRAWMASQERTEPSKILEHEAEFIDLYPVSVIEHVLKMHQAVEDWA